jgi:hypothetical protein
MGSFESLYGRKCNTPVSWDNPTNNVVIGLELLKDMEEHMVNLKKNLKVAQDRKKGYLDKSRACREFKVGEHVFLKVKEKMSSLRLGSFPKLAARHCGSFQVLKKICPVAYMFSLHASMRIHNVFHVSLLKIYVPDLNHVIDWTMIQMENEGEFWVELVRILDQKVKFLRNESIGLVKVQWTYYGPKDATWDHEETMREEYP